MNNDRRKESDFSLLRYAGLAMQWIILLVFALYLGKWVDEEWMNNESLFIWLVPLLGLVGLILKLIKETSK